MNNLFLKNGFYMKTYNDIINEYNENSSKIFDKIKENHLFCFNTDINVNTDGRMLFKIENNNVVFFMFIKNESNKEISLWSVCSRYLKKGLLLEGLKELTKYYKDNVIVSLKVEGKTIRNTTFENRVKIYSKYGFNIGNKMYKEDNTLFSLEDYKNNNIIIEMNTSIKQIKKKILSKDYYFYINKLFTHVF